MKTPPQSQDRVSVDEFTLVDLVVHMPEEFHAEVEEVASRIRAAVKSSTRYGIVAFGVVHYEILQAMEGAGNREEAITRTLEPHES